MSDDKNNVRDNDNDKAAEVLDKLRKMLESASDDKVTPNSGALDNASEPVEAGENIAADVNVTTEAEIVASEAKETGAEKNKSRYKSFFDDEPLFSFDGFAFDDEEELSDEEPTEVEPAEESAESEAVMDSEVNEDAEPAEAIEEIEEIEEPEELEGVVEVEEADDLDEAVYDEESETVFEAEVVEAEDASEDAEVSDEEPQEPQLTFDDALEEAIYPEEEDSSGADKEEQITFDDVEATVEHEVAFDGENEGVEPIVSEDASDTFEDYEADEIAIAEEITVDGYEDVTVVDDDTEDEDVFEAVEAVGDEEVASESDSEESAIEETEESHDDNGIEDAVSDERDEDKVLPEEKRTAIEPNAWRDTSARRGFMLSWDEMERFIAEKENVGRRDDYSDEEYSDDDYVDDEYEEDGFVGDEEYTDDEDYADGGEAEDDVEPDDDTDGYTESEAESDEVSVAVALEYFRDISDDAEQLIEDESPANAVEISETQIDEADAEAEAESVEEAEAPVETDEAVDSWEDDGAEPSLALERGYIEAALPRARRAKRTASDENFDYMDGEEAPVLATEIEEAVSIAEEYGVADIPVDVSKNLFFGDDMTFEEMEGPPTVATEIEELSIATEITSNIVKPEEIEDAPEEEPEEDSTSPDWVPDESFLRECAQLELPKLTHIFKPAEEEECDGAPDVRSSGYSYVEPPAADAYILEKARKRRLEQKNGKPAGGDVGAQGDEAAQRKAFYAQRAAEHRSKHRAEERAAVRNAIYLSILTFIILLLENIGNILSESFVAERAYWLLAFDIILLAVGGFIIRSYVKTAISDLFALRFNCELVGAMAPILGVIYGACAAFTYTGEGEIPLIGTALMACMMYSCVIRVIVVKRDRALFEMTFDEGEYCSLAELERNSAIPEFKELAGIVGESSNIYRPNYPKRTEGGYKPSLRRGKSGGFGVVLAIIGAALSLVAGGICLFNGVGLPEVARVTCLALLASLPVFTSVTVFTSRGLLIKRAAQNGALLLDERAVESLKNGAVLLINDTDMFSAGDVKITGFESFGNDEPGCFEASLGRIVSVIRALGGPISELFSKIGEGLTVNDDVELTDISEKGISGTTDGSFVRIGSASYMGKYGVPVSVEPLERNDGEQVVYISENGALKIKMKLAFKANKVLCKRINELRGYGVAVSLKTCDPCIDTELVIRATGIEPELLRVVKYAVDDQRVSDDGERDGGIISTEGVGGLIAAIKCCVDHSASVKSLKRLSVLFTLGVPVVFSVLALLGVPLLAVPAWTVGAYYGVSALAAVLFSKIS